MKLFRSETLLTQWCGTQALDVNHLYWSLQSDSQAQAFDIRSLQRQGPLRGRHQRVRKQTSVAADWPAACLDGWSSAARHVDSDPTYAR